MFGQTPPDPELQRRTELLSKLRNYYILSHDGISPSMIAGLEDTPVDWTNQELAKLGETWRVERRN